MANERSEFPQAISESSQRGFAHPEVTEMVLTPMQRALVLRREINFRADNLGTHPSLIIKEMRLAKAPTALKALEIQERYSTNYAYVGDIHGLTDNDFSKLRGLLLTGGYDHLFFIGDIGGSEKLAKLQRVFYQGGLENGDNKLWNKYRQLEKGELDDQIILSELGEGFRELRRYELELGSHGRFSRDQIDEQVSNLSDKEILEGVRWVSKHEHYGHYVSDLSDDIISSLASDVESYYERFVCMVSEIRLNTKAKVYVIRGNWDARLPFDFERETEHPVPLSFDKRRFNDVAYLRRMGVEYFSSLGAVETSDAVHILVPFDIVADEIKENAEFKNTKDLVNRSRRRGKSVIMVAHAVPAWEMHKKPSTGEGKVTEQNLRAIIVMLKPDELVYGHEHFIVKSEVGDSLLDKKYRLFVKDGKEVIISKDYESVSDLNQRTGGVIASHVPVPSQDFSGIASLENPKLVKDRRPRGLGGKRSPVRVGKHAVALKNITSELPGEEILVPDVLRQV